MSEISDEEIERLLREVIADERKQAEAFARYFHDRYEKFAPMFGYATREETREFDPESPNGKLMIFVFQGIVGKLRTDSHRAHATLTEQLAEAEKVVDECKGFTNLTAGKLASRYRERYPKE